MAAYIQDQGYGYPGDVETRGGGQTAGPSGLAPHEKMALRGALELLKEGRAAIAGGSTDAVVHQRLTSAHGYLCGFLEAKGMGELGTFVRSLPPVEAREGMQGDPQYDQMLDGFERVLGEGPETRFPFGLVVGAIQAAPTVWKAGKWAYKKIR
jgi:hypothetical protein